jgi:hypothetical protein
VTGNGCAGIGFNSSNNLFAQVCSPAGGASNYSLKISSGVFRDLAAWYHIVVTVNTSQSNPIRLYVNGIEDVGSYSYNNNNNSNNVGAQWNLSGSTGAIGWYASTEGMGGTATYFSGYMAEFYNIDGQALDASYFGQLDTNSGQWIPKAYSGTYGANGFYLKFADSSDSTAATLGKDSAALDGAHASANNWTPNGFAAHDQVLDSPTNNFCTWNPIGNPGATTPVFSNGALTSSASVPNAGTNNQWVTGTYGLTSGKWYWEVTQTGGGGQIIGVANIASIGSTAGSYWVGAYQWTVERVLDSTGVLVSDYGSSVANGSVIGIALDLSAMTISFSVNGTLYGVAKSPLPNQTYTPVTGGGSSGETNAFSANFGQGGKTGLVYDAASGGRFKYTPPAGFKALCTTNLPSTMPVVTSGTFTGNASADGPFVWLGGSPTDLTINGNTVTWGTHADKLANGFKVRTSSASYNASGSNSFSATVPAKFKWATARLNP